MISILWVDDLLTSPHDGDVCYQQEYSQLKMQSAQWSRQPALFYPRVWKYF